jgi:hypothetical protein
MDSHRQSALLLHGLAEADRRWVLEHLDEEDRRILAEHLTELSSLGIPRDPTLIDAIKSPSRAAPTPMHVASAPQMQALLGDEPLWLVQYILALDDWPWRQAFLDGLTARQRKGLAAAEFAPLGPKLAECLRNQLEQRLRDSARPADRSIRPAPVGLFKTMQRALREWF